MLVESVELRVLVLTDPDTADFVEAAVRRQLAPLFKQGAVYVEQVHVEHQASWR